MKDFGLPVKHAGSIDMERNWNEDCCNQPSMTRSDFFKMLIKAARVYLHLKTKQLGPDTAAAFLREKLDQVSFNGSSPSNLLPIENLASSTSFALQSQLSSFHDTPALLALL